MTNFFEHQDRARRNTRVLVWLMALAVLVMSLSIYALAMVLELWSASRGLDQNSLPPQLFQPRMLFMCLGGTAAVVAVASFSRTLSLRGGGAQIAEMLGGRLVSGNPRDSLEKRLLNVVEEMSIAAGVPVPQVFVLDDEAGINAFAAGFSTDDAAIAVTRACLEKLTRDELQGVIAHEFSHVLNGDMRLNIRLMGTVFGIVCIGLLGRLLMRMASTSRVSSRRDSGGPAAAFFVLGIGVFLIGTFGELFGKLIKAAISRQREFLADASAVQFTRNPDGIAGALKKIGGYVNGASITSSNADEASHFFFGDIHTRLFASSPFATHPALAERIARVDPSFHGEFPAVPEGIAQPDDSAVSAFAGGAARAASGRPAAGVTQAEHIIAQVGTATPRALANGKKALDSLSSTLREAAQSPFSACGIVYALLFSDQPAVREMQRKQLDKLAGARLHAEALRMLPHVYALSRRDRLPLVELLAPALRQLSSDQRATFTLAVQALIDADDAVSIFEYVLAETLRTRLSAERSAEERSQIRHRALVAVRLELELLLSLLAHAGDVDGNGASVAFTAGAARLGRLQIKLLEPGPRLLNGLGPALAELSALTPVLAAQVVDACVNAVVADRRITDDEATLLRSVCDALGAPLPQLE
jgi:Zn-dependent protease with chaperone function